jgi:hypothetical protein
MKPSQLSLLLSKTIPAKLPVLVKGAPGTGKSDIISQACESAGADLIISHPGVSDPTDYKGLPFAQDGKASFLPFGELQKLIEADRLTVFFLDDLGQAPPSVQAACMQLILARRINGHKVSEHVCFIAATNRKADKAGVSGILEPVKSRFFSIVELTPDLDDWVIWALAHNVPTELISFIRFRPSLLHDFKPSVDITNTPCPRTVVNVGKALSLELPEAIEYETIAGAAGETFAVEFSGFLSMFRQMVSPDVVMMNPDTAPIPNDISTLYALCTALSRLVNSNSVDRFFRYANRLQDEFSVMAVSDAIRMKPELQNTRSFIDWTVKHKEVMI